MARADDGLPSCGNYDKRGRGCRLFPWHPDQLTNIDSDRLPRIPRFNMGSLPTVKTTTLEHPDGRKVMYQELEDTNIKRGDLKIIGWLPFSTVCTYRFIDATEEYRNMDPKPELFKEISPDVRYIMVNEHDK
jgi:hypothetical protein